MKKAFTMLELVFVIVVAGILAAVMIPRTSATNPEQEAAIQLQSHIQYAQHLALINDKYDSNNTQWFRNRWQIRFSDNSYSVVSDNNTNFAVDPSTGGTPLSNINLSTDYSVTVSNSGSCSTADPIISFDHLGRPLVGALVTNYGQLIFTPCVITLTSGTGSVDINISPETGYAQILF